MLKPRLRGAQHSLENALYSAYVRTRKSDAYLMRKLSVILLRNLWNSLGTVSVRNFRIASLNSFFVA